MADGVLAPDGPSYRALVFNNQAYISPDAALKVLEFADNGLPIVVVGNLPNATIGSLGENIMSITMTSLASHDNVHFAPQSESLAELFTYLGVKPRVTVQSRNASLYSVWRSTHSEDFVFFYIKGKTDTFKLTFEISDDKFPYVLDAWTGEQSEVIVYERTEGGLSISITISAQQTIIVAFVPGSIEPHVTSHSANIEKVERGPSGDLVVFINNEQQASLTLSNSKTIEIDGSQHSINTNRLIELGPWNFTLESWIPHPDEIHSRSVIETIYLGPQTELTEWSSIDGLKDVSGVGIYTTDFMLPTNYFHDADQTTVLIHFGPILNTIRAWVNGKQLPPIDIANAQVGVSDFLFQERNVIRIEVASNLFNAVKARKDWIQSLGQRPLFPENYEVDSQPFGLLGPVVLKQLRKVVVKGSE